MTAGVLDPDPDRYLGDMGAAEVVDAWKRHEKLQQGPNAFKRGVARRISKARTAVTWAKGTHRLVVYRSRQRVLVWQVFDAEEPSPPHHLRHIEQLAHLVELVVDGRDLLPRVDEVVNPHAAAVTLARRAVELEATADTMARHAR